MKPLPYRQAIMAIIIKEDATFLIGSSPRDGGYKFPQGGIDRNEKHMEGLYRELKEELNTNLIEQDSIVKLESTFVYKYPDNKPYSKIYSGQQLHVFIIKHRNSMVFQPQDDEFDQLHWISQSELNQFDFRHRKNAYYDAVCAALEVYQTWKP